MGWEDRDYGRDDFGRRRGFWGSLQRGLERGDLLNWSAPLGRVLGIEFRVHWIFLLFIVVELLSATARGGGQLLLLQAVVMAVLVVLVSLHEIGHCLACRRVGGEADRVMLWPLGGLAYTSPPNDWRSFFITTAGGPLVNVALWPLLGAALLVWGASWDALVFNPFTAFNDVPFGPWFNGGANVVVFAKRALWYAYFLNVVLLGFNVLLPMFPMDGGRLVQELLWRKMGYERSMRIATGLGMAGAVVVGLLGIAFEEMLLFAVALFAGFTCWQERQRAAMMGFAEAGESWKHAGAGAGFGGGGVGPGSGEDPSEARLKRAAAREAKQREAERAERVEVDRILDKVHEHGLHSLSRREKGLLKRATERQRGSR